MVGLRMIRVTLFQFFITFEGFFELSGFFQFVSLTEFLLKLQKNAIDRPLTNALSKGSPRPSKLPSSSDRRNKVGKPRRPTN